MGLKKVGAVAVLAACLGACVAHQIRDRDDFLAEGVRTYPGESRERVLQAARTVLQISDPDDFEFRDTLTGFTGLRRYVIYAVIAASQGREKWEMQTESDGKGLRAAISVSEAGVSTGGYSTTPYEGRMASVPLYRLFWDRVDYMLGRRPDWVSCDQAEAALAASNTGSAALGGLCGPTSNGRNAPPPQPLPSLVKAGRQPRA